MMRALSAGIASAVLLTGAVPAIAADDTVTIGPVDQRQGSNFELTMKPGTAKDLKVSIANRFAKSTQVETYAAATGTVVNGGFEVKGMKDPVTGAAKWVEYPSATLDMAAGESVLRPATVTVPEGTGPGEYYAALLAEWRAGSNKAGEGVTLNQRSRTYSAIVIRVPGQLTPAVEIPATATYDSTAGTGLVLVDISNTGNQTLRPDVTLTLKSDSGQTIKTHNVSMPALYADSATKLTLPTDELLATGQYFVDVSLTDEALPETVTTSGIPLQVGDYDPATTVDPPATFPLIPVIIGALLALLLIAGLILLLRRRRNKPVPPNMPPAATPPVPAVATPPQMPPPAPPVQPAQQPPKSAPPPMSPPPTGPPTAPPPPDRYGPPPSGPAHQ